VENTEGPDVVEHYHECLGDDEDFGHFKDLLEDKL